MCDHLCPIITAFDAAKKVIGDYTELHEDPEANLRHHRDQPEVR